MFPDYAFSERARGKARRKRECTLDAGALHEVGGHRQRGAAAKRARRPLARQQRSALALLVAEAVARAHCACACAPVHPTRPIHRKRARVRYVHAYLHCHHILSIRDTPTTTADNTTNLL